jgi:hypothetical protein
VRSKAEDGRPQTLAALMATLETWTTQSLNHLSGGRQHTTRALLVASHWVALLGCDRRVLVLA